jgi:hypothetical protein
LLLLLVLAACGCYAPRTHTAEELRGRADVLVEAATGVLPPGARVAVLPMQVYGPTALETEGFVSDILADALRAKGYEAVVTGEPVEGTPSQQVKAAMASAKATHALQTYLSPTPNDVGHTDEKRVDLRIDLAEDGGVVRWLDSQTWTLATREFSVLRTVLLIVAIPIAIAVTIFMIYLESEGIPVFRPHTLLPPPPHHR